MSPLTLTVVDLQALCGGCGCQLPVYDPVFYDECEYSRLREIGFAVASTEAARPLG
jgi:hypothetical protein